VGRFLIHYWPPESLGYHVSTHMAHLAAELLEGDLIARPLKRGGRLSQVAAMLSTRGQGGGDAGLLICTSPSDLFGVLEIEGWRRRFKFLAAWVFDSFWVNYIPRFARNRRLFDHVFITEQEDLEEWKRLVGGKVSWLPWGSDVLRLGSARADRSIDLLRVGRQPPDWQDDTRTEEACRRRGLRFQGRPEIKKDPSESMRHLMETSSRSKFILTFSNKAAPAVQTHPTREYITGRWVDALSAGATVAGISPHSLSVRDLFWPGALLEFPSAAREEGLERLQDAVRGWTPAAAERNHRLALERLDWRWRFQEIATAAGISPAPLARELEAVRRASAPPAEAKA
jgi:hypothetical protein